MAMDSDIATLERLIGHDGSKIINPGFKGPGGREGFHFQQIIDAALALGYAPVPIEAAPVQTATGADKHDVVFRDFNSNEDRFRAYLSGTVGVIMGVAPSGYWHAIAWNGEKCYDPQGRIYPLSEIKIRVQLYWLFCKTNF
jgi:hypothetical protein